MKNLHEVVFEGVNKSDVSQILNRLVVDAEHIIDVDCTENIALISDGKIDTTSLELILSLNEPLTIFIKLKELKFDDFTLPLVLLRLVKYDGKIDVDFSFDTNKIKNMDVGLLMKYLHSFAKKVASECNVRNFFGGMEPAADEYTRYFTNQSYGPLN